MQIDSTLSLNNNVEMPILGLGVFRSPRGEATQRAVHDALEAGYRHIDTAAIYGNETDVGKAVHDSGIPRRDVFITTKLWNSDQGYESTLRAMDASLEKLQTDHVDLYLMHWPVPELRLESWRAMETILAEGKARAIGVSNFMKHHLQELLQHSDTVPAVNQIELSPYNYLERKSTVEYCREHDIAVEAYSPLTKGRKLEDPALVEIASHYEKTPAQVLIRWALQHSFIVIPKSNHPERILENGDVFDFEISRDDMNILDNANEALTTGWDPGNEI